jgi:hypothetical protein
MTLTEKMLQCQERPLRAAIKRFERLQKAAKALYGQGYWMLRGVEYNDQRVQRLWEELRDAAGIEPGTETRRAKEETE